MIFKTMEGEQIMCVVSMVGDVYNQQFKKYEPFLDLPGSVTRKEFDELKREVETLKKLLIKAKEYDEKTNQPECEQEEKVALLKKVAEMVGVDLKDVLG